jgi:hypothetical protein
MKPISFKEQNSIMGADQPQYLPLPACRHKDEQGSVTSCWGLSWKDLIKIIFSRRIYLTLATFNHPIQPQKLTLDNPSLSIKVDTDKPKILFPNRYG